MEKAIVLHNLEAHDRIHTSRILAGIWGTVVPMYSRTAGYWNVINEVKIAGRIEFHRSLVTKEYRAKMRYLRLPSAGTLLL